MLHRKSTIKRKAIRAVTSTLCAMLAMLLAFASVPAFAATPDLSGEPSASVTGSLAPAITENSPSGDSWPAVPGTEAPLPEAVSSDDYPYSNDDDTPVQANPSAWEQQEPLAIYVEGTQVTALKKTYGDADFTLTATGGSGYGFFWWFSDNWLVAEINQDGRVHIRSVGEANIWLWYRGGTLFEEVVPTFVHLTITQATPRLSTVNPPVAAGLPFGKPLASSALSGDVLGVDGTPLIGTLAWEAEEAATLIPGSVGHETSVGADGKTYRARQDGVYYAPAVFTPAQDIYGGVYAPITLLVKVPIYASEDTRTTLEKEVQAAAGSIRPKLRKAEENYDASSLARFYRALEAVERALAADTSQASSQDTTEALLSELAAAEAGLRHDHSVLTNSADTGVSETGRSVTLRIKGELTTVTGILLNETHFALGVPDAQSGERALTFEGRRCGTVRAGSVIIELSSDFVDSLDNGSFAVAVDFDDGYQKGSGSVSFTVSRKAPLQNDDSPEAVAPSGPESPVFFAAPAAPAVVAVIVDDDTPLGAPLTSSSQGAAADNGEESLTLPPEALAAIEQSQALADTTAFWVFIVPLAAAVVALVVGTLLVQSRKLLRNKGEKNAQS